MEKYTSAVEPGLAILKANGLIVDFRQREDLYWHVDNHNGKVAVMNDEMTIGFIEGVFSQNQDLKELR